MKIIAELEKVEVTKLLEEIRVGFVQGVESWKKTGERLVELLDKQGMALEEVVRLLDHPSVSVAVLRVFERIGRGMLLPALMAAEFPAARFLASLDVSAQRRLMNEPVEVFSMVGGRPDTLNIRVQDMTLSQCKQVFGKGVVRAPSAQRAWINEQVMLQERKKIKRAMPNQWEVVRGELVVREACTLTKADLLAALGRM
jgi:hypothetical protein